MAIDLNSDLGESFGVWTLGDDAAMLGVVTSANVACGFHAGDPSVLRAACTGAVRHGVAIGAQVSYPDLIGFGRRHLDMTPDELRDAVLYQLGALDAFAQVAGSEIAYVKPHGALYHSTATDPAPRTPSSTPLPSTTRRSRSSGCPVPSCSPPPTSRPRRGRRGVRRPGVPARRPAPVAPRARQRAHRPRRGRPRAVRIAVDNEVVAVDGTIVSVRARSICVHSDTPGAVDLARAVRTALDAAGVGVHRFTDDLRLSS